MVDFSEFAILRQELCLIAVFVILLIFDIFASGRAKEYLYLTACVLMGALVIIGFLPAKYDSSAFGGMYVNSPVTVFMKNILNIGTFLVFLQSYKHLVGTFRHGEFYVIMLSTLLGMYLMVSAGNLMMLFIGIETASLPVACLAAFDKYNEKSAEAGAKYILMTALASGIMMFGLSYLYGATGTFYFEDLQHIIVKSPLVLFGFVFFFAGLAFKISIVPFHLWTADVYEGAPTPVTAYLSVVSKGAAVFALIFSLWHVFGNIADVWHHILWVLSVLTIVIGNLFAIGQKDIKRFFAFSSISQAGYILLGVMSGTAEGMTATVYYVLVYLFSNMAVFGVISAMESETGRTDIASYNGFYSKNPKLAFIMMLAVFSLAGIPPFAGFFSKFFIFAAAAREGEYILVFIALLNTVISLYYYLLIVKAMFITPADENTCGNINPDGYNKLNLVLCTVGIIIVGIISGIYEYIGGISFGM